MTGSLHGAYLSSAPVELGQALPSSCAIGPSVTTTGTAHVVARVAGVTFVVVLLPASAVKVGRNRLWHLRDDLAARLSPEVRGLLTRGRSGEML